MRRLGPHMSDLFSAIIPIFKVTVAVFVLTTVLSATLGAVPAGTGSTSASIPQDAIRIRIIANSDADFDQKVKADVRDRVADVIRSWGSMPSSHDEARALIASHLADIRSTADTTLRDWNASYGAEVELAEVPFPDKVFGGRTYSSGDYEALRITLGGGTGANWWCVLFPPLCLTAATKADDKAESQKAGTAGHPVKTVAKTSAKSSAKTAADTQQSKEGEKPEARFFLWEMLKGLANFIKSLFS